jgi:hypothetical protein
MIIFHSASFSYQGTMSFGDSKAVFEQRAKAIGLSEDVVTCFRDKSLDTMAKFAFGCNYSPGASDDKPFRELLAKVLGREPTLVEESCLRRLYNESYATVAADIRAQTEQTSEDVHRKLAPADRAARLEEQQARLKGIAIRGPYEPGDSLVDRFVSFYENDRLQWVPWDMCVSREHELLGNSKRDQQLVVQSSGELKLAASNKVEPCDTSSEILLRYCVEVWQWSSQTSWHTITMTSGLKQFLLADLKLFLQVTAAQLFSRLRQRTSDFSCSWPRRHVQD